MIKGYLRINIAKFPSRRLPIASKLEDGEYGIYFLDADYNNTEPPWSHFAKTRGILRDTLMTATLIKDTNQIYWCLEIARFVNPGPLISSDPTATGGY